MAPAASALAVCVYDGTVPSGTAEMADTTADGVDQVVHRRDAGELRLDRGYDDRANLTRASARPVGYRLAPQTAVGASTDLVRVADFADDAAAFSHYSKHVRGIEFRPNGGYRLAPGGADMPEFGSFADYRGAARSFMGPDAPSGVLQGYRGTDLLRVDPKTGYFGVRSQGGAVRTFFRPDGDPIAYFWGQL